MAGIITLPIYFGAEKLRRILEALHLATHIGILTAVFLGFIKPELLIFLYSGLIGYLSIYLYCSSKPKPKMEQFRDILVDGEWIVAACIRALLKLSPLSVLCSS
jgi:4-hydroxybenzoate polyprenyltransferase